MKQKILRRGDKNTQKNYAKKVSVTQITMTCVLTHLEPDTLRCEAKRALNVTTDEASWGDGISEAF